MGPSSKKKTKPKWSPIGELYSYEHLEELWVADGGTCDYPRRAWLSRKNFGGYQIPTDAILVYQYNQESLSILFLIVHPDYRRQGMGAALVRRLKQKVLNSRRRGIEVLIPDTHLTAHLFFRDMGFVCRSMSRTTDPDDRDLYRFVWKRIGC